MIITKDKSPPSFHAETFIRGKNLKTCYNQKIQVKPEKQSTFSTIIKDTRLPPDTKRGGRDEYREYHHPMNIASELNKTVVYSPTVETCSISTTFPSSLDGSEVLVEHFNERNDNSDDRYYYVNVEKDTALTKDQLIVNHLNITGSSVSRPINSKDVESIISDPITTPTIETPKKSNPTTPSPTITTTLPNMNGMNHESLLTHNTCHIDSSRVSLETNFVVSTCNENNVERAKQPPPSTKTKDFRKKKKKKSKILSIDNSIYDRLHNDSRKKQEEGKARRQAITKKHMGRTRSSNRSSRKNTSGKEVEKSKPPTKSTSRFDRLYNLSKKKQDEGKARRQAIIQKQIERARARNGEFQKSIPKISKERSLDVFYRSMVHYMKKECKFERKNKEYKSRLSASQIFDYYMDLKERHRIGRRECE